MRRIHIRRLSFPNGWTLAGIAVWCAFSSYVLAESLGGPPLVWADSKSYAHVASAPLSSAALWTGQRPPLVPLFVKVFGASHGFVAMQATVAAVSWCFLAGTLGRQVPAGWRRLTANSLVLALASSLPLVMWDRSVLSESLSLSLLALLFAMSILLARRVTWPRVAVAAIVSLAFAATRDAQVSTILVLAFVVSVFGIYTIRNHRSIAPKAGVLAAALFGSFGITQAGQLVSHRADVNVADVLYVRVFPYPQRVAWFVHHGMPEGTQIDELAAGVPVPPETAKVVAPPRDPEFAPLDRWIDRRGSTTYLEWLFTHPGYDLFEPLRRPERAYNFASGDLTFYAPVSDPIAAPLSSIMWPPATLVLLLAGVTLLASTWTGAHRLVQWRVVLLLVTVSTLAMLVSWHGDGQETTRHTVEGVAGVRMGVWILFALALLSPTRRTRDVPSRTPDAP